jgi:fatty acid desaturase
MTVLLVAGLAAPAFVDALWLLLLDAAFLALVFAQIGFLGHDLGHRQVFASARRHRMFEPVFSFVLGVSQTWWIEKHNQHHRNPNDPDIDPDATIPVLAFSEEQARGKRGALRWLVRYQAFLFFPLLLFEGIGLRVASLLHLRDRSAGTALRDLALITIHLALYVGALWLFLGPWKAILFASVHQGLFGLYAGTVFAPNHKGMLLADGTSSLDFLRRQVLTSRNVRSHPFIDFWYGGLNYQIEHHLFPTMPRCNLRQAKPIVQAFCRERGVSYYETGMLASFKEVLVFLHDVSAPLREPRGTSVAALPGDGKP